MLTAGRKRYTIQMKIKIHVDINQFEFVETELEGEIAELQKKAQEFQQAFHGLCRPEIDKGNAEAQGVYYSKKD